LDYVGGAGAHMCLACHLACHGPLCRREDPLAIHCVGCSVPASSSRAAKPTAACASCMRRHRSLQATTVVFLTIPHAGVHDLKDLLKRQVCIGRPARRQRLAVTRRQQLSSTAPLCTRRNRWRPAEPFGQVSRLQFSWVSWVSQASCPTASLCS
jgi:hypothetical protein